MDELVAPDSSSHGLRQHPQMIQAHPIHSATQRIENDWTFIIACCVRFVLGNETRLDAEKVAPTVNPSLRITPVSFGSERNLGQGRGIVWFGSQNLHRVHCQLTTKN